VCSSDLSGFPLCVYSPQRNLTRGPFFLLLRIVRKVVVREE
jgi:hypothetical protein